MKIRFLTMEKAANRATNSVGSSRIRARWVYKYWDEADEWIIGENADVMVFQKVYFDRMMEAFEGITILDVCDPDFLERDFMKYVDKVDAVVTSTQNLADYIEKFRGSWNNKNIIIKCIPDRLDFEEHRNIKKEHRKNIKTLVWFGYSHNFHYLESTFEILNEMGVALTIISDKRIYAKNIYNNMRLSWKGYDYKNLHNMLIEHDVALFPTRKNLKGDYLDYKAQFKSNNKRLNCMALGLPIIELPEDFKRLESKEAREQEAKKNLEFVKKECDVKKSVQKYKDLIKQIQNEKDSMEDCS